MAKRHPTRRRVQQQSSASEEDVFVARVFELSEWARKNSQLLILAGIALVLVLGGVVYYWSYRRDQDQLAVQELESVQQVVNFGLPQEAEIRLNEYLQRFGGTRYGLEARLLLGQVHLRQDQPEQAIEVLAAARERGGDPLGIQLRSLLARAYEEAGRLGEAVDEYVSIAGDADMRYQRTEALADAARLRTLMSDHAGAAELYRRILDDMENEDPNRGLYEMRLAEAELEANA